MSERSKKEEIDKKKINKHRNDVFRLVQLLPRDAKIRLAGSIRADLVRFIETVGNDGLFDPKSFGVPLTRDEGISLLRSVYELNSDK